MSAKCEKCCEGWICEAHPDLPWPHDDCSGHGMPCDAPGCALSALRQEGNQRLFEIGQTVKCFQPGSWVHHKTGVIKSLDVQSSDGICGHLLKMDESVTVLPAEFLQLVKS